MSNPSPKTRKYVYRVLNALLLAAVVFKVVDGQQSAAVLLVINAALGLASANVEVGDSVAP